MNRLASGTACALCAIVVCAGSAGAQPPVPGASRPAFSPYLNLVRPGGTPALNYYGLVRPELQFRQSIQNLQTVTATNQQSIGDLQSNGTGVPSTGHPTQFLNYGGYFLSNAPTGGGPRMTAPPAANRPGGTGAPPRRTR